MNTSGTLTEFFDTKIQSLVGDWAKQEKNERFLVMGRFELAICGAKVEARYQQYTSRMVIRYDSNM